MTITTPNEINIFREQLKNLSSSEIEAHIRHHIYGEKNNWKYKEAMAYSMELKNSREANIKKITLEHMEKSNNLQKEANVTARWVLVISIIAIIISILVAYLK